MRNLRAEEIAKLSEQGCSCDAWERLLVADNFNTDYVKRCHFSGDIRLGSFSQNIELPGGIFRHTGICNASLHNVSVGDNSLIENVHNYISNYDIESDVIIRNVDHLYVEGESSFGSGVEVSVLNETGGREVLLSDSLSAQLAYFMAFYRQNKALYSAIKAMIEAEVSQKRSHRGLIMSGARLYNVGTIRNVRIGNNCLIDGVAKLSNGTINSNASDPVFVGNGVMAENFIFASGAHVSNSAVIVRCFIGQACHIGHLFSAHDSLFFSNCQGENGEACAVFAGPYTVSMHKSSLLIAGYFSFLNAGSGSNQSNHMYKLGPIHQGIVERGSKTTSDSYILWPARVGAFSLVMGRHVRHSDTSELPFSYLLEKNDDTYLVPGVNLRSVGTIRDAQKWPKRDKRKDPNKLDCINFNLLSPYTIHKMIRAKEVLNLLQETAGETSDIYTYHSAKIKNSSLRNGLMLYSKAIHKFLGNSIISRLKEVQSGRIEELRAALAPKTEIGLGNWIDVCGLFAPQTEIDRLVNRIACKEIVSLAEIQQEIQTIHAQYYEYEWTWAAHQIETEYGKPLSEYTAEDVVRVVNDWKEAVVSLDEMLYQDAKKEFSKSMQIGFGLDAHSPSDKEGDFFSVRGDFENNPFVIAVKQHITDKSELGNHLIERISQPVVPFESTTKVLPIVQSIEEYNQYIRIEQQHEQSDKAIEPIQLDAIEQPTNRIEVAEIETIAPQEPTEQQDNPEEENRVEKPKEEESEGINEQKFGLNELTAEQKERQRRLRLLLSTDEEENDEKDSYPEQALERQEEKVHEISEIREKEDKEENKEKDEDEKTTIEEGFEPEKSFRPWSDELEKEIETTRIMLNQEVENEPEEEDKQEEIFNTEQEDETEIPAQENLNTYEEEETSNEDDFDTEQEEEYSNEDDFDAYKEEEVANNEELDTNIEEETPQENSSFDYMPQSNVLSLGESFEKQMAVDLKKAISLNDKYRFQRLLFEGDSELMNKTFDRINDMSSYEEAIEYLQSEFNWPHDNEDAAYFYSILDKRFE